MLVPSFAFWELTPMLLGGARGGGGGGRHG